jgi:hypothetical protein
MTPAASASSSGFVLAMVGCWCWLSELRRFAPGFGGAQIPAASRMAAQAPDPGWVAAAKRQPDANATGPDGGAPDPATTAASDGLGSPAKRSQPVY